MSLFDAGKICTFSPVQAKLTLNGEPAIGAQVTRTTQWKDPVVDTAETNSEGEFSFSGNYEKSVKKFLPVEIMISQQLLVTYQGETYEIWANGKMNADENSELDGLPLNLTCELTEEMRTHRTASSLILTNCHWEEK